MSEASNPTSRQGPAQLRRRARSARLLPWATIAAVAVFAACAEELTTVSAPDEAETVDTRTQTPGSFRLNSGPAVPTASAMATLQFLTTPTGLDFGEVQTGTTSPQQVTNITNVGTSPVVMSGAGGAPGAPFNGAQNCQGVTLAPGASCQMFFTFTPTDLGPASGTSSGTWNGQAFSISLTGTGVYPLLAIGGTQLDFGEVQVGATSPQQTVDVTNVGTTPVTMSGAGGAPGGSFGAAQSCQGTTLAPGASCQMVFTFSPTAAGPATGTSNFTWNGKPFSIGLRGTGRDPQLLVTPSAFDFGEVLVGTTSPTQHAVITNVGPAPLTMSGSGGAPGAPFGASQSCQGLTLAPGASCEMLFTFSPTAAGAASATSNFTWNGLPFTIPLRGTGRLSTDPQTRFLLIAATALHFGEIQVGSQSAQQSVDVVNVGPTPITMSGAGGAPGGDFNATQGCQGLTLNPGEACQMFFQFGPTAAGPATATSNFTWNGEPFQISLDGTGVLPKLIATPVSFDFGDVQVGTTASQLVSNIMNTGSAPVLMSGAGGAPGIPFNATQNCQGLTLAPGAACQMFFTFSPTAVGPASASSHFTWTGVSFTIPLVGNGRGPRLLVSPTGLEFGEVAIGTTSPQQVTTITNLGPLPVTMSGAGGAPGAPFSAAQSCQGVTLNAGESCQMIFTFSPTMGGPASGTSNVTWNDQPYAIALHGFGLGDDQGPVASGVSAAPNPVQVGGAVSLTATVSDVSAGGSLIASAEYSLNGGPWTPMAASDLTFDQVTENVTAALVTPASAGIYPLCVRGSDVALNTGAPECTVLVAYDPSAGFVTGGGWFDSPAGAFVDDPTLTGRATFGLVARYKKGKSVPDGNTAFQFQVAGLSFASLAYDFLVINQGGTNAQFKGTGRINQLPAPNGSPFRFMTWATDGSPDTFRIKIWWENGGAQYVVYDNGVDQPLGGGSIVIQAR